MAQAIITRRKGGGGVNKDLPEQVTAFTAVADNTPQITLSWQNPTEYWAGTLIVKKAGSAPEGVNDGEKIYNGTGTSFVDTAVEYDVTYFYRAYPYNSKKQYQTEVLTVSTMPRSGLLVSTLPVGALIRVPVLSAYQSRLGEYINWTIADRNHAGYPDNSTSLATQKIIQAMAFDAKESDHNTGNSRYIYSNIRQWLNSDAEAGAWYSAQHSTDAPPTSDNLLGGYNPYYTWAGFLAMFPSKFVDSLLMTTHTVGRYILNKYSTESCIDKMFLATCTEVGLTGDATCGSKLALFSDDNSRLAYPTSKAVSNNEDSGSSISTSEPYWWWLADAHTSNTDSKFVLCTGGLGKYSSYSSRWGVRPFCNISNDALVDPTPNADGSYTLIG